jgi:transcription elongation factor SPT5
MDAEKQAELLRQRHQHYGNRRGARGFGDAAVVPKRLLLPSVDDPGIWAVRCKEGKEREVVFSIMKRIEERMATKGELAITSAFERGGAQSVMKGFVYVEAQRQTDILVALDGILNVYPRTKMTLVDIKDMPELLRVTKTATLEPGAWVRLRRPAKHSGDLAQVQDVTENGLEAKVRFIPRLDYGIHDDSMTKMTPDGKRKRVGGAGPKPPLRLFSEVEARKRHPRYIQGNPTTNTWNYMGDEFENGFQVRDVKIQQLIVADVNPTLEEVTRFASGADDGTENLDLKALAASLKDSNTTVTYLPGDIVEVYAGEQKGMVGKATNVQGDIVTMTVTEGDLEGQNMEVPIKALRKRFKIGDHVKVIGGSRFQDEVGTVVKISEDRVTMLTDHTNNEVTVFSKDLREASDIGGQGSIGQFSLHDLIQLDQTTVACVVKVDRDSMVVLDQFGDTRQVMPSQIPNKIPKRKQAVAADREGSEIRLDDVVKEFGGQQRQGKIIHIHRSYVFLHTNESTENAGVFVTKASLVNTVAAKGGRVTAAASGPDLDSMNPALKIHKNGAENKNAAPVKMIGRDRAINQTVIIKKGAYKGLLGIVKDTTDTHARVELHTKGKTITVPRESLNFKDKATGATIDINGRGRGGGFGRGGGDRVPGWQGGSRTPMAGSGGSDRVPAWGSRSKYMLFCNIRTEANTLLSTSYFRWTNSGVEGTRIFRIPHAGMGRWVTHSQSVRRQPDRVRFWIAHTSMAVWSEDTGCWRCVWRRITHTGLRRRQLGVRFQDACMGSVCTDAWCQWQRHMGLRVRRQRRSIRCTNTRWCLGSTDTRRIRGTNTRSILCTHAGSERANTWSRLAGRLGRRLCADPCSRSSYTSSKWLRGRILRCTDAGCASGDTCG